MAEQGETMKCRFEWYLDDAIVAWLKEEAERKNRDNPLPEVCGEWTWKKVAMSEMTVAIQKKMEKQQVAAVG